MIVLTQGSQKQARVLTRELHPSAHRVKLDALDQRAVILWLGQDNLYHIASTETGTIDSAWTTSAVRLDAEDNAQSSYTASQDFDVALGADGATHIAFRDGQSRQLLHLWRAAGETSWQQALIDDGRTSLSVEVCSAARRQQIAQGVGVDPDLISTPRGLLIAYHDADCGDLRLGQRGALRWQVSLVDQGEGLVETPGERSVVGRWPSVAYAPDGSLGISYHDVTLGRLMFAYTNVDTFNREVVDERPSFAPEGQSVRRVVGAFSELSFDAQSTPMITYFDATQTALTSAQLTQSAPRRWNIKRRLSEGFVGLHAAHVRLPQGQLWFGAEQLNPAQGKLNSALLSVEEPP